MKDKRNRQIVDWNRRNAVKKTVTFYRTDEEDMQLLEFADYMAQDTSFCRYVKRLIKEDGGFVWEK